MQKKVANCSGFTFIELLVVMAIVSVLLSIALLNFQSFSYDSLNATAKSDYRNVKMGLLDALTQQGSPQRFVMNRVQGPRALPAPLQHIHLSEDVEATVFYDSRIRRNRRPRTLTRIEVYHRGGTETYRYTERNGVFQEQVIER